MTEPARVLQLSDLIVDKDIVLGPASVVSVAEQEVHVHVSGEPSPRMARIALATAYRVAEGDEVLVLGRGPSLWIVGVIAGTGATELQLPGDVTVRAVGGTLRLEGDRGVEVKGAEVRIEARVLAVVAEKAIEKVDALYQRVRGLLSIHAERVHTTVDETQTTTARSSTLLVEETAMINGKQIHLG